MITTSLSVLEDGSVNGRVLHSLITRPVSGEDSARYSLKTSSAGMGHEKHDHGVRQRGEYGVAGEDVYGHDGDSIFVADGHGMRGLEASTAAIEMRRVLSSVNVRQIVRDVSAVEVYIRESMVNLLHEANFEYSGSTFVHMRMLVSGGRRFVLTTNVGDSEALLIYRDRVHVCSVAHSWDDLRVYNRYVKNCAHPKNVCYNRWNASRHRLLDPDGGYRPMMLYDVQNNRAVVNRRNLEWLSGLYKRANKPSIRHGTQGVRIPSDFHENWGSSVMLYGTARGQNMATFGDVVSRAHTKVPMDMVHVYVHEVPANAVVVGIVQSDGISNRRTLMECGYIGFTAGSSAAYLSSVSCPRDDMSVAMFVSEPIIE